MQERDSAFFAKRAAEARATAEYKGGGRDARVAGHLALAYEALARAKKNKERKDS